MKVNCVDLISGCVLSSDVYVKSSTPIMLKKTVLTQEHIDVLEAFLIRIVDIEPILVDGESFTTKNKNVVLKEKTQENQFSHVNPIVNAYLQGVEQYKTLFQSWQQGKNIDIFSIVSFFNPLIDLFLDKPFDLMGLYHYSTEKGYIFHHSVSVGLMSAYFATKLKYSPKEVSNHYCQMAYGL